MNITLFELLLNKYNKSYLMILAVSFGGLGSPRYPFYLFYIDWNDNKKITYLTVLGVRII